MKITFSNLDDYIEKFYNDLSTSNDESLMTYTGNIMFAQTMSNNSENSKRTFRKVHESNIKPETKDYILRSFYNSIISDKKERVLQSKDMTIEEFVEYYSKPIVKEIEIKKVPKTQEEAEYILDILFYKMISCNDSTGEYIIEDETYGVLSIYEVVKLIKSYKEFYKKSCSDFAQKFLAQNVNSDYFIFGDGFEFISVIFYMWSKDTIRETIKGFEQGVGTFEDLNIFFNVIFMLSGILDDYDFISEDDYDSEVTRFVTRITQVRGF